MFWICTYHQPSPGEGALVKEGEFAKGVVKEFNFPF